MSIKPILFYTDMVRALLANRKTVTRRVVKMPAAVTSKTVDRVYVKDGAAHFSWSWSEAFSGFDVKMPYRPGDILYVRETWEQTEDGYAYKADSHCHYTADWKWRPSIHMPREAARIFLRVTDVRVERLQDSFFKYGNTIFYLQREGIDIGEHCRECIDTYGSPICNDRESECGMLDEVRGGFSDLWDSTIKPADCTLYGWAANPWVWVIEFERISREEAEDGLQRAD